MKNRLTTCEKVELVRVLLTGKDAPTRWTKEKEKTGGGNEGADAVRRWGRHGCGPPGKKRTTHCNPGSEEATLG